MNITLDHLHKIVGALGAHAGPVYVEAINAALDRFHINTQRRVAAFLAQNAHESGGLTRFSENLNYSAQGLMKTWPSRFPDMDLANEYARQPAKIANFVYANRMGNGPPESGDGWRYRGAGWLQITGKRNQIECADFFGIQHAKVGDWLRTPHGSALSAGRFWQKAGCNELADLGKFDKISDLVNIGHETRAVGDAIGYRERLAFHDTAYRVLA